MRLRTLFLFTLAAFLALPAQAQMRGNDEARVSPNAMTGQTIGTTEVSVTYGRPSVRDRVIFGDLVPYDAVWRTGANEATTITFSDDVLVEGERLEAGTYGLFTIPGEDEWTVIFNDVAEQWGAMNYDEAEDALRVTVEPQTGTQMEQMSFHFHDVSETQGDLVLHWDDVMVPVTISTGS